jgi:hypothetical protein
MIDPGEIAHTFGMRCTEQWFHLWQYFRATIYFIDYFKISDTPRYGMFFIFYFK